MAKNFIAVGDKLNMTAPYTLASGQGFLVGALFLVAQHDAANGALVVGARVGVWDLPKEASLAISAGARVFWDNTNKVITTTTTSNFHVGFATVAAAGADTTVRVVLDRGPAAAA